MKIPSTSENNYAEYATIAILYKYSEHFEEALDFFLRSIECPCEPSLLASKSIQDKQARDKFGFLYYNLKRYDEAKKFYFSKNQLNAQDLAFLSCIYSIEGDYTTAFKYFKKAFAQTSGEISYSFPMISQTFDMLIQQSNANFKEYGIKFLKLLKAQYYTSDMQYHLKNNWQSKEAANSIKTALAEQKLKSAQDSLSAFDKEYQYLWSKLSSIEENLDELFIPLNKIAQKIENNFDRLRKIQQPENFVLNFGEITELGDSLQKLFAQFFTASQKIKIAIANTRRLKNRTLLPVSMSETIPIDDSKTMKAQILEEQASADAEKRIRAHIAEEKKVQRNIGREGLKVIKAPPMKAEVFAQPTLIHNALISFKDASLEEGFKNGELPANLMEILTALNSSTSIYDLRTRLKSGTKLEKLKGDRKGQKGLRTNGQYRLCFTWVSGEGAHNIEHVDYH